jgi:hypothetical protein
MKRHPVLYSLLLLVGATASAVLTTCLHSSRSSTFLLHPLTPSFLRSSSKSSNHLFLGLPLLLLPSGFQKKNFLNTPVLYSVTRNSKGVAKIQQKILFIQPFHDTLHWLDLRNSYCVFLRITLYTFILTDAYCNKYSTCRVQLLACPSEPDGNFRLPR